MARAGKATSATKQAAAGPTERFFEELSDRGQEPLLKAGSGTLRFDLTNAGPEEHWYVTVNKGKVTVSHANTEADTVVSLDRALCDRLVTGRANAIASLLRSVMQIRGDLSLFVLFQRLFPGPPRTGGKAS